jgi:GNAT superfamily N-acetyltransferase
MSSLNGLLRLSPRNATHMRRATEAMVRAFADDPLWAAIIPDRAMRLAASDGIYGVNVRYAARYGEVYSTSDNFEGAAVWLPPGDPGMRTLPMLLIGGPGLLRAMSRLDRASRRRMFATFDYTESKRKTLPAPYWYLSQLGVVPERQGQGYGSRLLAPMLARCDVDGVAAYLETETTDNVAFYEKRGFRVLTDEVLPDSGARLWTMWRAPQPTTKGEN